jgi:hypothetical protein
LGALVLFVTFGAERSPAATLDEILQAGEIRVGINAEVDPEGWTGIRVT